MFMNTKNLLQELYAIPHLDLGLQFDAGRLLQEYKALGDVMQPYKSKYAPVDEVYKRSWHGVSLYSPDGSLHNDLSEGETAVRCKKTELADRCPYMMEIISNMYAEDCRSRIMQILPNGQLAWHSHVFDNNQPLYSLTVHVPIVMPETFRYSVINIEDYRFGDIDKTPLKVYNSKYAVGHAMLFNSMHVHNVFNDDPSLTRTSLMIYLDLRLPKVRDLIEYAVWRHNDLGLEKIPVKMNIYDQMNYKKPGK
jgi:hypothetical protein